jgi:hypothetical protein
MREVQQLTIARTQPNYNCFAVFVISLLLRLPNRIQHLASTKNTIALLSSRLMRRKHPSIAVQIDMPLRPY